MTEIIETTKDQEIEMTEYEKRTKLMREKMQEHYEHLGFLSHEPGDMANEHRNKSQYKDIILNKLQAILHYHDLSDETGFEIIPMDRDVLSVVIHDPDSKYSECFERPVAIILNSNLMNDLGNEKIAEALHIDMANSVNKWDMSLIEACLLFTVLSIDFGHIPQDRNTIITTETLKTWAGKHVDSYIPTAYCDAMASCHNRLLQEEAGSSDIAPGFDDNNLE